ncbi:MAG: hypothetical protein ACTSWY_06780 [Promethearchaeota archaeon]
MQIRLKNPSILFFSNWIILLLFFQGIPLKILDSEINEFQSYVISFLCMSFDFFGNNSDFFVLIFGWIISISIFSFISDKEFKIPLLTMLYQVIIFIFTILFMSRYSPIIFNKTFIELLYGLFFSLGMIGILFIPIFFRKKLHNLGIRKTFPIQFKKKNYIIKCPYCGTEYNSNPAICYNCSKIIEGSITRE